MKTNVLKIDFMTSTLIMDRTFAKSASIVGSQEYQLLQNARQDYPTFTVSMRAIKRNPNKESYRGLTYVYMEKYIAEHDDENQSIMKEYLSMRVIANCHSVRYPTIKKWFLETYPEIVAFSQSQNEQETDQAPVETKLFTIDKPLLAA